ncbi:MAG: ABC transporter permease [Collinsella sp.]
MLPLIYTNVLSGFESVDPQMLEMARVFRLSPWRTFMYVYRPAVMPFLASSCKISLGMSWKSGIMAEVLAMPDPSIGKQMNTARTFLNTPDLFAWTVVVMILARVRDAVHAAGEACGAAVGRTVGTRRHREGGGSDVESVETFASGAP